MKKAINKTLASSFAALVFLGFGIPVPAMVHPAAAPMFVDDKRAPEVPDAIAVEEGYKVHFHGLGVGVQIYTWDGTSWGAAVPDAKLFDDEGNIVADHFVGPTWRSNSGSEVVGTLAKPPLIVDRDAIPWLLLRAVEDRTHGPGIFAETKFIHRVNTLGGKAPTEDGTFIGQVARVSYMADYFFYRQAKH